MNDRDIVWMRVSRNTSQARRENLNRPSLLICSLPRSIAKYSTGKFTKAVNATHQTRHSKHAENAHRLDLSTIATGLTPSSARLGFLCRGTWVPKRFYLQLCCYSPWTKGPLKGQSNPLLGNETWVVEWEKR